MKKREKRFISPGVDDDRSLEAWSNIILNKDL